jgi:hypothetical protein
MIARLLRRGRAVEPAIRKIEPSKEVQAVEREMLPKRLPSGCAL